jgi:hypothetical protein
MSKRNLKDLFCAFCKKSIADHHIDPSIIGESVDPPWRLYRLHCTECGHNNYVSRIEAEK